MKLVFVNGQKLLEGKDNDYVWKGPNLQFNREVPEGSVVTMVDTKYDTETVYESMWSPVDLFFHED